VRRTERCLNITWQSVGVTMFDDDDDSRFLINLMAVNLFRLEEDESIWFISYSQISPRSFVTLRVIRSWTRKLS
jgi:hypothetical protein